MTIQAWAESTAVVALLLASVAVGVTVAVIAAKWPSWLPGAAVLVATLLPLNMYLNGGTYASRQWVPLVIAGFAVGLVMLVGGIVLGRRRNRP